MDHNTRPVFGSLFNQVVSLQICNFIQKRWCFSVNIAKLSNMFILKKIWERLLLNNVYRNYSSMNTVKQELNVSQHSQENTFTGVSFILAAGNFSLSLFKKRFWHWCFPDSLTTTFLKGIVISKISLASICDFSKIPQKNHFV